MQALVVDNADPLGEGRVRLTYPWLNQSMETEWCRVCQLYAGSGYGSFFVPEKGDEVLVACVHGDLNEAVVLGGLYNGKDKPASKRENAPGADQKLIRTKGEHQLLLDDTQNGKKIELKSSDGHSVLLDDQDSKLVIDTGGGQIITMEKTGGAITISTLAGQSVKLDGTGTVTLTGPMKVQISAAQVEIGALAATSAVVGEAMMAMFSAHTHALLPGVTAPPTPTGLEAMVLSKTVKLQA
ncbi:phage baseplate assembly protein V [Paraburkholderia terrae]